MKKVDRQVMKDEDVQVSGTKEIDALKSILDSVLFLGSREVYE